MRTMECSHWPTPTQAPTQTPTPTKWVCNPFASVLVLLSVHVSVSASMNTSTQFYSTHFLSVSVLGSVNTPLELQVHNYHIRIDYNSITVFTTVTMRIISQHHIYLAFMVYLH